MKDPLVRRIAADIQPLPDVAAVLNAALARKNDPSDKDNGYIVAKGYDEQLDSLRDIKSTAQAWLANLEQREREATGIKTLKVNSNRVFGYYIEVSKSLLDKVPYRYQRRQTLVNAERSSRTNSRR